MNAYWKIISVKVFSLQGLMQDTVFRAEITILRIFDTTQTTFCFSEGRFLASCRTLHYAH